MNQISSEKDCIQDCELFERKLLAIQKFCKKGNKYVLGNLVWTDNLVKDMKKNKYPSTYFVHVILCTMVFNDYICNIPLELNKAMTKNHKFIPFNHNKLMILDALWSQGSKKVYFENDKYIYSEHSGVIVIKEYTIKQIDVFDNTTRIDEADDGILLPTNTDRFNHYHYMFHTHPNNGSWGGRIKDKVVYEVPSASDIFNYVQYYNSGKILSSVVVSPEGMYVIRTIKYVDKIDLDDDEYDTVNKEITALQKEALKNLDTENISDPDIFHERISSDTVYIAMFNDYLKKHNLYIEYYPRVKRNNEWVLTAMYLVYIKP